MSSNSPSEPSQQWQSSSNDPTTSNDSYTRDQPPSYDTLSLAPPSIRNFPTSSSSTSARDRNSNPDQSSTDPESSTASGSSKSWKQKWQNLKEEDAQRRADRVQHVSAEEADRITGLDRHRAEEEKKSAERKRGGKSMLGVIAMC